MFKVWFNGHEITEYLKVTSLERGIGTTRTTNLQKSGNNNGKQHISTTLEEKNIQMSFVLRYDLISKRRKLAELLDVTEEAELIFSDEPDKYYMAMPTGDIDVAENNFLGYGEITWLVPDGVAYAVDPKEFSNVNKEPVVIKSDFAGKIAGSEVECPHTMYHIPFNLTNGLPMPNNTGWSELVQSQYDATKLLDGKLFNATHAGKDIGRPVLIPFNILSVVQRAYPFLFEGLGESEQVEKFKNLAKSIVINAWGKGSGPTRNRLTMGLNRGAIYDSVSVNATSEIAKVATNLTTPAQIALYLNNKGEINVILYADPSDGTTPSSVSLDYTNVEITLKLPNGQVVTIVNDGSYSTYPILEATIKGDNGLVSFINDNGGVLQFGNPDEIDGYDYQTSDHVIWEPMQTQGEWEVNKGQIVYPNYLHNPETPNVIAGDIDWTSVYEMAAPIFEDPLHVWNGPTIRRSIPKNSNNQNTGNFSYKARFRFATTVQAIGRFHFQLQNETAIPFAVVIRDSVGNRKEIVVEIWFNEEIVYQEPMSTAKFNSDFFEVKLERFGTEFKTTFSQISKIVGSKIYYAQTYFKSIDLQEVSGIPVTHITQWVARYSTRAMPNFEYTDTKFTWINVDKWQELPNRFMDGDVLRVDTSSGEILLNNVPEPSLMTRGNQWGKFELEKGQHNILCVQSSWAKMPDVKVIIREAYL